MICDLSFLGTSLSIRPYMPKRILITGGAGFIGSHLADALIRRGDEVCVFDNLEPQIHPDGIPDYLNPAVTFLRGDVRDREAFKNALEGVDVVVHFAAAVGTGQSMYQVAKYSEVNIGGLSNLLDILIETGARPKILFPGSATSYGECTHRCTVHGIAFPELRSKEQLERRVWDVVCPQCGKAMEPMPTPEHHPLRPKFVYGIQKKLGEELLQAVGEAYDIPYTILRFFNVYGPRQSLSNPYTGVLAIFSSLIKSGKSPIVIEDGQESRDFISVHDIVRACLLTIDSDATNRQIMNVGTGKRTTILELANLLIRLHGGAMEPVVNQEFRVHDFRHNMADISRISTLVGFTQSVALEEGLRELVEWSKTEQHQDAFVRAYDELRQHGLVRAPEDMAEPRVAAVILNWNGYDNTVECVEALQQSTYTNLEIVVVDNGSEGHDVAQLKARFGNAITLIENATNLGVAGGNNSGLRYTLSNRDIKYSIMMNNDLMVTPEAVAALVREAESNANVGMVASRMMNYFERDRVDSLGIFLLTSGLGYNRKNSAMPLFCPCSGFALYRADALRQIADRNGDVWDNAYFAYVDELDVGFRVRMRGFLVSYADDAVAYHKDGATSGGAASDFSLYHGHRNNLWFILKDFPAQLLWQNLFPILSTQIGALFLYAKRRRVRVILRAKWAALRGLPRVGRERKQVQKLLKVPIRELTRSMVRAIYVRP